MKKLTVKDINNIKIFAEAGYAIQASEWTSGSGRYTRRKATPVFTDEYNREDFKHALETGNTCLKGTHQNAQPSSSSKRTHALARS